MYHLLRILSRRRWTVLAVLSTIFFVAMIWIMKQPPIYRATVSIQVDDESRRSATSKDDPTSGSSAEDAQKVHLKILAGRPLARQVIEELHLEFEPELESNTLDAYMSRLQVSPDGSSRLVKVSFESKDPQLSARVVTAHAKHFVQQHISSKWEDAQQAAGFFEPQLVTLRSNFEKSQDKLQEYARDNQLVFTDEGTNRAIERLSQLEHEFTKAQADRIEKESYEKLALSDKADFLPQLNTAVISGLRAKLAELKREDSALALTQTPEHPARQRVLSQISEIEKTIQSDRDAVLKTIKADYSTAAERESSLAKALEQQRKLTNDTNQRMIQYNILKREVDSNKELYEGLLNRLKDAGLSAALQTSNVRIVEPAEVPQTPVLPHRLFNMFIALGIALVAGIAAAIVREFT